MDLDWAPAEVTLSRTGKVSVGRCRGDVGSGCTPGGGTESCERLAYGGSVRAGDIRCACSRKGITCPSSTDGARHGIRVSRAGVTRLRSAPGPPIRASMTPAWLPATSGRVARFRPVHEDMDAQATAPAPGPSALSG